MDVNGKTDYKVNDSLPASDLVLWSSIKTSRFFWKNTIKSQTIVNLTSFNTATALTIPFTGTAMVCAQAQMPSGGYSACSLNGASWVYLAIKNNYPNYTGSNVAIAVKTGDTLKFITNAATIEIQVFQI